MSLLVELADIAEDLLFFGMTPPEIPARSFHAAQRSAMGRLLDPARQESDIAPRNCETADFMWQSIRLMMMARRLKGLDSSVALRVGAALDARAMVIFEGYCRMTPRWLICQWLLNDPSPAPHWETAILHAISFIDAGARIGGEVGDGMQAAGAQIVCDTLALALECA